MKQLISKIITQIRISPDGSFEESGTEETTPLMSTNGGEAATSSSSLRAAKFDSDYLNEIVDKVLNVLKNTSRHYEYLRMYQGQLTVYLRESLIKYENKRLVDCIEDILIDISDILYNELTFYSIMSTKGVRPGDDQAGDKTDESSSLATSTASLSTRDEPDGELLVEQHATRYKGVELLKKLNDLINAKFVEEKSTAEEKENQEGKTYKIGLKLEFFICYL